MKHYPSPLHVFATLQLSVLLESQWAECQGLLPMPFHVSKAPAMTGSHWVSRWSIKLQISIVSLIVGRGDWERTDGVQCTCETKCVVECARMKKCVFMWGRKWEIAGNLSWDRLINRMRVRWHKVWGIKVLVSSYMLVKLNEITAGRCLSECSRLTLRTCTV